MAGDFSGWATAAEIISTSKHIKRMLLDSSPRFQSLTSMHPITLLVIEHTFGCGQSVAQISMM
jgi:hypothetical protein